MTNQNPALKDLLDEIADQPSFVGYSITTVNSKGHAGETPLHVVMAWPETTFARILLDAGADPNALGEDGETPLHRAVIFRRLDLVELLVERGASKNAGEADGLTPLDIAKTIGWNEALEFLSS